jgi:pentatricopeptide repeat protein
MITACVVDKNFDAADRVWESMRGRFPHHKEVLTGGLVALELEPGAPRLDKVLRAWESALEPIPH